MTAADLSEWLDTDCSKAVGWKGQDGARAESVGHASGHRILSILRKSPGERTPEDEAHMRKVVGFVRRHRAQEPANPATSRWRYSLMNWGHDPIKCSSVANVRGSIADTSPAAGLGWEEAFPKN